jgi:hypothetical protein
MFPTASLKKYQRTVPSGTWRVEIRNLGGAVTVDSWIQRGDTPFGYPLFGRQSRFDDDAYERFDLAGRPQEEDNASSYIKRKGTLNALATGQHAIVIGGFRRSDKTPSRYSGSGPVGTPGLTGPDASAVADDSAVLHGVLAAGTRTGSVVALSGTSVAAPQVTRIVAKLMTQNLANDRAAIQDIARAGDPNAPTPERLGAGRIKRPPPRPRPKRR